MGKRSRLKKLARLEPVPTSPSQAGSPKASGKLPAMPPSPRKRWLFRITVLLMVPALVLLLAEGFLRLGGYGYSTRFFERHEQPGKLTTNPQFAWQFYSKQTATTPTPLVFPLAKAPGTRRIFVLGESAAAGTPDPAYGFARMLELMLEALYPSNRFEILNAAMRGINSHIILPIARECAGLSPDLFLIYMGNNEAIGLHAPSPEEINFTSHLWLLRLGQKIKATRLAQVTQAVLPKRAVPAQDMEYLRRQRLAADDPERRAVDDNFRANLSDLCEAIADSGARGVISSLAVNLRDFPPLGSLHRRDLSAGQLAEWEKAFQAGIAAEQRGEFEPALAHYQSAARLDDHHAELHYRLARCAETAGQFDLARHHFGLARDWDALQFRGDSRLNAIVRSVATNREPHFYYVDLENALAASGLAPHGIPGKELFHEHVHFTFEGDYQTARAFLPAVVTALGLPPSSAAIPSREDCARLLAFTPMDDLNVRAAMARQTAKAPFLDQVDHARRQAELERGVQEQLRRTAAADFDQASAIYREALARRPQDWMLRYNYANLLSQFGQKSACLAEYAFVVRQLPRQRAFRLAYGQALLNAGQAAEAIPQFQAALETDPNFPPAREALAAAQRKLREPNR